jgi:hypothetical protein
MALDFESIPNNGSKDNNTMEAQKPSQENEAGSNGNNLKQNARSSSTENILRADGSVTSLRGQIEATGSVSSWESICNFLNLGLALHKLVS